MRKITSQFSRSPLASGAGNYPRARGELLNDIWKGNAMNYSIPIAVAVVACLVGACTDIRNFKVSNWLTWPLLISGFVYHGLVNDGLGFWGSFQGALFGFGTMVGFYILGGMGAGDVKLMAGLGAWLGLPITFLVFVASGISAGIYAIALVMAIGKPWEELSRLQIIWLRLWTLGRHLGSGDQVEVETERVDRRRRLIPFAAMMAIGLLLVLVGSWLSRTTE